MQIYEKVARRLKNTHGDISEIIKKDILRKIRKDIETLKGENIIFGIEPLTTSNLMDFYNNIYLPVIGSKENAKVNNILNKLTPEEIATNTRFFAFIRKGNTLLGGGIFNYTENILKFGYKANIEEYIDLKAGFGTLIDFLFFSFGIEKGVNYFSYGVDRNGYGGLGASHGVCLHKLLLGFKPYIPESNNTITIDENTIVKPTIIFNSPNDEGRFQEVILLNFGENNSDIFLKRGFTIKFL